MKYVEVVVWCVVSKIPLAVEIECKVPISNDHMSIRDEKMCICYLANCVFLLGIYFPPVLVCCFQQLLHDAM